MSIKDMMTSTAVYYYHMLGKYRKVTLFIAIVIAAPLVFLGLILMQKPAVAPDIEDSDQVAQSSSPLREEPPVLNDSSPTSRTPETVPKVLVTSTSFKSSEGSLAYTTVINGSTEGNVCKIRLLSQQNDKPIELITKSSKNGCDGTVKSELLSLDTNWTATIIYTAGSVEAVDRTVVVIK